MPSPTRPDALPRIAASAFTPVTATARLILALITEKAALTGDWVVSASEAAEWVLETVIEAGFIATPAVTA